MRTTNISELLPYDKEQVAFTMPYRGRPKQFGKTPQTVILKDAVLYFFEQMTPLTKVAFPLKGAKCSHVPEEAVKLSAEVPEAKHLVKIAFYRDGQEEEMLLLASGEQDMQEWITLVQMYSKHSDDYLRHKIQFRDQQAPQLKIKVDIPKYSKEIGEIACGTLGHLAGVKQATFSHDCVVQVFGDAMDIDDIMMALKLAGIKAVLVAASGQQ